MKEKEAKQIINSEFYNLKKEDRSQWESLVSLLVKYGADETRPVKKSVSDANGGQIPKTITFQLKDLVELLSMADMALQPDFPINKSANLLNKIKQICLKYGINWTGRQR